MCLFSRFIVLFIFLFYSCDSNYEESADVVSINFNHIENELSVSDIFHTYDTVHLKTPDEYFLSNDVKFEFKLGYLAILQHRNNSSLIDLRIFDVKNGNQISKINSFGRGPNEMLQPYTMTFNKDNDLEIFDRGKGKIFKFNVSGSLIDIVDSPFFFEDFLIDSLNNYVLYTGRNINYYNNNEIHDNIIFTDHYFKIIKTFLPFQDNEIFMQTSCRKNLKIFNNQIYVINPPDNKVYNLDLTSETREIITLNFNENNIPSNIYDQVNDLRSWVELVVSNGYCYGVNEYWQNSKFQFLKFNNLKWRSHYYVLFNKISKKFNYYNQNNIINDDIDLLMGDIAFMDNDIMITISSFYDGRQSSPILSVFYF